MALRLKLLPLLICLWAPAAWAHPFRLPLKSHTEQPEQQWQRLPPERKEQILRAQRQFQKLSPAQQQKLWREYQRREQAQRLRTHTR